MPTLLRPASGSVFHYTSAQGLIGIVQDRTLRASQASGLNDLAEVRQGWDAIRAWLSRQSDTSEIQLLKSFAEDPLKDPHQVFVLCASTEGDDASQWRLYAQGGAGYAVELDSSVPLAVVAGTGAPPTLAPPSSLGIAARDVVGVTPWLYVMYAEDEVFAALDELRASMSAQAAEIDATAADDEERDWRYEALRDDAYEALSMVAHLYKSRGFMGEQEARVIVTFVWERDHIHYRPSATGIVGFVNLASAPSSHSGHRVLQRPSTGMALQVPPAVSVRQGPLLGEEHPKTVKVFLREHGLKAARVVTSEVPLRP